jgi:hypothetical protein
VPTAVPDAPAASDVDASAMADTTAVIP